MTEKFIIAPQAARDIAAITDYLEAEASAAVAGEFEAGLFEKFEFLADFPGAGHSRSDITPANVRFFPLAPYLIAYRVVRRKVKIVAVLHGHRDVPGLLKDR